jgi:hypothetical protein
MSLLFFMASTIGEVRMDICPNGYTFTICLFVRSSKLCLPGQLPINGASSTGQCNTI